jgi:hypothetical protein
MRRAFASIIVLALAVTACGGGDTDVAASRIEWSTAHTSTHWWMSVAAISATDQWIVGGTTTEGAIRRFDGTTVTEVDHGADVGLLNWIHHFGDGSLVVVGNDGAVVRSANGSAWNSEGPVTDQDLWGVWGASPDDVWAVGGDADGGTATVLRDTGSGFEPVAIPDLERPGVDVFFKVWGSSADDVYIVGQNGAVLRWDGTALEELFVGVSQDLIGVWGDGPDQVVVVGGRRNGAAAVWDGTGWSNPDLGRFPGLNGVWVSDGTAWVVGDNGAAGTIDLGTFEPSISLVDTPVSIHAVNGTASTLTSVGGDFSTGPEGPFLGQVLTAAR